METSLSNEQRERVRAWVKALRETKERQVKSTLGKEAGGRCCLGIECDVYKALTGKGYWIPDGQGDLGFLLTEETDIDYDDEGRQYHVSPPTELPERFVYSFFGLEQDPVLVLAKPHEGFGMHKGKTELSAATMNDEGYTFAEIADAIERTYDLSEVAE